MEAGDPKTCPTCGAEITAETGTCPACGGSLMPFPASASGGPTPAVPSDAGEADQSATGSAAPDQNRVVPARHMAALAVLLVAVLLFLTSGAMGVMLPPRATPSPPAPTPTSPFVPAEQSGGYTPIAPTPSASAMPANATPPSSGGGPSGGGPVPTATATHTVSTPTVTATPTPTVPPTPTATDTPTPGKGGG